MKKFWRKWSRSRINHPEEDDDDEHLQEEEEKRRENAKPEDSSEETKKRTEELVPAESLRLEDEDGDERREDEDEDEGKDEGENEAKLEPIEDEREIDDDEEEEEEAKQALQEQWEEGENENENDDEGGDGEEREHLGEEAPGPLQQQAEGEVEPVRRRSSWMDEGFATRVAAERQRKSSLLSDAEWDEIQPTTLDAEEETPPVKTFFDAQGFDAYGNSEQGFQGALERSLLEDLGARSETSLHRVVSFLLPRGAVNLSGVSKAMRERMVGAPLFLDYLKVLGQTEQGQNSLVPRVLRLPELEFILGEVSISGRTVRKWTVGGVLINISDLSTLFRLLQPGMLETMGIINNHIASIGLLRSCENLKHLELHHCSKIGDLEPLRSLARLERLQLLKCPSISSIEPLRGLERLNLLLLYECPSLSNIEAVRALPSLENLGIHNCPLITSYAALQDLEKLKVVEITYSRSLTNVSCLRQSTSLSHLDLSGCEQVSDISTLGVCGRNLENLKLGGCALITDISALSQCTKLQSVWLNNLDELEDLSPLAQCRKMVELRMKNCAKATGLHALAQVVPNLQYLFVDGCRSLTKRDAKAVLKSKRLLELDVRGTRPAFLVPLLASSDFQLRKAARVAVVVHANRIREYDDILKAELVPKLFALINWQAPEDERRDRILGELREIAKQSRPVARVLVSVGTMEKLLAFLNTDAIPLDAKVNATGLVKFLISNADDGIAVVLRLSAMEIFVDIAMQACESPADETAVHPATIAALAVMVEVMGKLTDQAGQNVVRRLRQKGVFTWLQGFVNVAADLDAQVHALAIYILGYAAVPVDLSLELLDTMLASLSSYSRPVKKLSAQLIALFLRAEEDRREEGEDHREVEERVVAGSEGLLALMKELMEDPKNASENLSAAGLVMVLPPSLDAKLVEKEIVLYMLVRLDSFALIIQREFLGAQPHIRALIAMLKSLRRLVSNDDTAELIGESVEFFARVMPKLLFLATSSLPHELYLPAAELLLEGLQRSAAFKSKVQSVYRTKPISIAFNLFAQARGENEEEEQMVGLKIVDHLFDAPEVLDNLSDAKPDEVTGFIQHLSRFIFKSFRPPAVAIAASVVAKAISAEDPANRMMHAMIIPIVLDLKRWDAEEFAKLPDNEPTQVEQEHDRLRSALSELFAQFGSAGMVPAATPRAPVEAPKELTEEELEAQKVRMSQYRMDKVGVSAMFLAAVIADARGSSAAGVIDQELLEALFHFLLNSSREEAAHAHESIIGLFASLLQCLDEPKRLVLFKVDEDTFRMQQRAEAMGAQEEEEKQGEQEEDRGQGEGGEAMDDLTELVLRGLTERMRQMEENEQARNEELQAQEQARFQQRQRKLMQLEKVSASLRGTGPVQSQGAGSAEEIVEMIQMVVDTLLGEAQDEYPRLHEMLDIAVLISRDYSSPSSGAHALQLLKALSVRTPAFDEALAAHADFLESLEVYLQETDEGFVVAFFALATALAKNHAGLVVNRVIDPLAERILNDSDKNKERAVATVYSFVSASLAQAETQAQPSVQTLVADTSIGQSILIFLSTYPHRQAPILATAASTIKVIVADQASVLARLLRAAPEEAAADFVRMITNPSAGELSAWEGLMEMLNNVLAASTPEDVEALAALLVKNGILEIVEVWDVDMNVDEEEEEEGKADGWHSQAMTDAVLTVINLVLHLSNESVNEKIKNKKVTAKLAKLLMQKPNAKYARALTRINPEVAMDHSQAFEALFSPFEAIQDAMDAERKVSERQASDDDIVVARVRGLPQEVSVDRRYNLRFGTTWTTVAVTHIFELSHPKVYLEVEVVAVQEGGVGRVGWIAKDFSTGVLSGDMENGIGSDELSWGYSSDGRVWLRGQPSGPTGTAWEEEDVIGLCVDMEAGIIQYSLNGTFLGKEAAVFDRESQIQGIRPAVSGKGIECVVNLGIKPFQHSPVAKDYVSFSNAVTRS